MKKKIVIVGGVAGGATTAARLRRLDESAEIILFERGEYISYANCGLPYYIGDTITSRAALLLQTPEGMKAKYGVDVRIRQEVVSIDRKAKTVSVRRADSGEVYTESYDTLVLSTGSSPLKPPIPGIDHPRIMTLWTVPDTDRIKAVLSEQQIKTAVVVGGGFIGLEMAENLRHAGVAVTLVEMLDQVMAPLDFEMAQLVHEHLTQNGVTLCLGDGVSSFVPGENGITVQLSSGKSVSADLVILSIGVRPNSELARAAGLTLNSRGGVVTDDRLMTSDPDIYAVGDMIEVEDFVQKVPAMIPLAGPANKQGRIAADLIAGVEDRYTGTQGTSIAKVFDLSAASTGVNEKALIKRGLVRGRDYERVILTQNSHAGYYPGAVPLTLKLLFSTDGKRLFGAQIVGRDGVDKRIDTLSVALRLGASVQNLKELEFAYAPPYSSAKDPVNMAGFVAENVLRGIVTLADWDAVEKDPQAVLLDVREDAERMAFTLPHSINIPLGKLRSQVDTLDKRKHYLVFCAIGVRAYNAARILAAHGISASVYPGGTRFYQSTHFTQYDAAPLTPPAITNGDVQETRDVPAAAMRIDCSGLQCPGPIMKVFETMKELPAGAVMEVSASDPGFSRDIGAWCRRTGHELIANDRRGSDYVALVRKAGAASTDAPRAAADGKTIVVFSGDLDKALASFIIANGAAAMGRPVTMFFTFWGLNILRKPQKQAVRKTFLESMFGAMLPRGAGKLKLSKLNMGGMGTAMMQKIMKDKNVDSLDALLRKAMDAGVKLVACTMSMDVMGIKAEELIDGVELGGVGAYLGDAEESNVNLFI